MSKDPNKCCVSGCGRTRVRLPPYLTGAWRGDLDDRCREHCIAEFSRFQEIATSRRLTTVAGHYAETVAVLRCGIQQWPKWGGSVDGNRQMITGQIDILREPEVSSALEARKAPGGTPFAPLPTLEMLTNAVRALCGSLGACAACSRPAVPNPLNQQQTKHGSFALCERCWVDTKTDSVLAGSAKPTAGSCLGCREQPPIDMGLCSECLAAARKALATAAGRAAELLVYDEAHLPSTPLEAEQAAKQRTGLQPHRCEVALGGYLVTFEDGTQALYPSREPLPEQGTPTVGWDPYDLDVDE